MISLISFEVGPLNLMHWILCDLNKIVSIELAPLMQSHKEKNIIN